MRGMKWFWLCLLMPTAVLAGQQANPLPVFALDGAEHALHFTPDGVRFQDRIYEPVGKNIYEHVHHPAADQCPTTGPGRLLRELKVDRRRALVTYTEVAYLGCGQKRLPVWSKVVRQFSFDPPADEDRCYSGTLTFGQKGRTLSLTDRCDGTLELLLADVAIPIVLSRARRGRYFGSGLTHSSRRARWRIGRLTWKPSDVRLKVSGRVFIPAVGSAPARTLKLKGTWTLERPPEKEPVQN